MIKLDDLIHKQIITNSGRILKPVTNILLEVEQLSKNQIKNLAIKHLVIGTRGILELIGLKEMSGDLIPWEDVLKVGQDVIIVKDKDYSKINL